MRYPVPRPDQGELLSALAVMLGQPEWAPVYMEDTAARRAWFKAELLPLMKGSGITLHLGGNGGLAYTGKVTLEDLAALVALQAVAIGHLSKTRPRRG